VNNRAIGQNNFYTAPVGLPENSDIYTTLSLVPLPRSVTAEDARALAEKDTELELRDAAQEARQVANIVQDKRAMVSGSDTQGRRLPTKRWIWIVAATVLAIVAVVVGAVMGSR
jgi:hypothetical protein